MDKDKQNKWFKPRRHPFSDPQGENHFGDCLTIDQVRLMAAQESFTRTECWLLVDRVSRCVNCRLVLLQFKLVYPELIP